MIIKTVIQIFSRIFFLSNEWILTASHCVDGTDAGHIQVGSFFGNHQKVVMIIIVIMPWLSSSLLSCHGCHHHCYHFMVMIIIVIIPLLSSSFQYCSWSKLGQIDFLQWQQYNVMVCLITDAPGWTRLLGQRWTGEDWTLTNHQFNTFMILAWMLINSILLSSTPSWYFGTNVDKIPSYLSSTPSWFFWHGCWSISILTTRWGWTSPRSSCTPTTTPTPSTRTLLFSEWQIR